MHRYKAFLKVVEVGSFTKAAELLGYTQPALSQMMTSLERELSMKLLYRSRYGIRLTPEGERLYPSVETAVRQYDAMRRSLPDPIWWLSGSKDILPIFMRAFAAHLSDILQENEPSATMEETE